MPKIYPDEYVKLRKDKRWIEACLLLVPLRVTQFSMLISKGYIEPILEDENVFTIISPYNPLIGLRITNLPQKTNEDAVFI